MYYYDWLYKTLLIPQSLIYVTYTVVGHIFFYLDRTQPSWYKTSDVNSVPRNVIQPTYWTLMAYLIPNFLISSFLGFLALSGAPTDQPVSVYDEPDYITMVIKFIANYIISTLYFYWSHRLFHTKFLYRNFHYLHHQAATTICSSS